MPFLTEFLWIFIIIDWKHVAIDGQTCQQSTKTLPTATKARAAIYSDDSKHVYIFGGYDETTVYKWDLDPTHNVESIASNPSNTDRFYTWTRSAILIANVIWFIGMRHKNSYDSHLIFKFNVMTETWEDTSSLVAPPVSLSYGCLSTNHTHFFLVDGYSNNPSRKIRVLQIYNIADNSWKTTTTPFTDATGYEWYNQYCHMVNDELFVFGGDLRDNPSYDVYKYTVQLDEWTPLQVTLPAASDPRYGSAVFYNDVVYLVGEVARRNIIMAFDIHSQTIDESMTYPVSVDGAGVTLVDNVIYMFGGNSNAGAVAHIQYCVLPTKEPTAAPSPNPSVFPVVSPTANPLQSPPVFPCVFPSVSPTENPSSSLNPTLSPMASDPTTKHTKDPTENLISSSSNPTLSPITSAQTSAPTKYPGSTTTSMKETIVTVYAENDITPTVNPKILIIAIILGIIVCCCFDTCLCYKYLKNKKSKKIENAMGNIQMRTAREVHVIHNIDHDFERELLASWLRFTVQLPQYIHLFISQGYDTMQVIQMIEGEDDLRAIGIKHRSHQRLILTEIKKLQDDFVVNGITHGIDVITSSDKEGYVKPEKYANTTGT